MPPFSRFRLYHWLLAIAFGAAYLSGDDAELAHVWLGYGLIALLAVRLVLALARARGFPALLPKVRQWKKPDHALAGKLLTLGLVLGFVSTLVIGVSMIDNRAALSEGLASVIPAAQADDDGEYDEGSSLLNDADEVHEWLANATLALVGLHLGWLLLYRRRQAWAMLGGKPTPPANPGSQPPAGPAPGKPDSHTLQLRVADIRRETADAVSIYFDIPADLRPRFAYRAGQFLTLAVPTPQGTQWRCYSFSSAPDAAQPRITVKRVAGGAVSGWLNSELQVGDTLEVMPPAGRFVLEHAGSELLLLGAGSGITPLFSILHEALAAGSARIRLIYANRDADSVIFAAELERLQLAYPQRLQVHHHHDACDGRLESTALAGLAQGWHQAEAFICGPAPFMQAAEAALRQLGMDAARIHIERFGQATTGSQDGDASGTTLQVATGGREYQLAVRPGERLLDSMERAGLKPASGCRAGACGACKCKVTAGRVKLRDNLVLSDAELAEGWTLACQAEADSRTLKIRL